MVIVVLTVKVPTVDIDRSSGRILEIPVIIVSVMPCMFMMTVLLLMPVMLIPCITMVVTFAGISEPRNADRNQT